MSAEPPPPPPPPPPPAGYQQGHGAPAPARAVPPPLPEVDPSLIRPSRAWYWVAGTVGVAGLLASTALSISNALGDADFAVSTLAWICQLGGGGLAAIIGGITWSRRSAHKRQLQRERMAGDALT